MRQERLRVEFAYYFLLQHPGSLFNHNHTKSSIRHREDIHTHVHCVKVLGHSGLPKSPGGGHQSHVTPSATLLSLQYELPLMHWGLDKPATDCHYPKYERR